jgi:hypothetical protein
LESALPLIRRALKILSDREVSPQLGLLKSTLLQLDSTFSERDYGVGSFRDFIQKLANNGYINLKQVDRSLLVELKEGSEEEKKESPDPIPAQAETIAEIAAPTEQAPPVDTQTHTAPVIPASEASKALEEQLRDSNIKPHWPMYLRTFKQLLRSLQPPFDERQYGLSSMYDLVRQAHRDGLLHVERNRQGILRIFPGERFPKAGQETSVEESTPMAAGEPELISANQGSDPTIQPPELELQEMDSVQDSEMMAPTPETIREMQPFVPENEMSAESEIQPETQEPQEINGNTIEPPAQKPKPRARRRITTTGALKSGKSSSRRPRSAKVKNNEAS